MKRMLWLGLVLALFAPCKMRAEPVNVCVIAIREDINHNTLYLVRRGLREAVAKNAHAVILDMDTNGGRVDVTESIIKALQHSPIKVHTFVNPKAFSAGAYIAAATENIYMAPGSVIGAATPVMLSSGGEGVMSLPKAYEEKLNSAMRALIRATAEQKGHNPDVFEAMVDSDKELVIDGKTLNPKGKLLTLTDTEAAHTYGKPPVALLSAGTLKVLPELFDKLGLTGVTVIEIKPYGFEVLARWITTISPLLIIIGLVGIFIELKTPGVMLPGLVAVIAFSLYFLGYFGAGLAGWEELALFAVGVVLLALEIFVIPGFGVTGIAGILAIAAGLLLAMVERWPGATWPDWTQLQPAVVRLGLSLGGTVAACALLVRWLPQTSLFQKLELGTTLDSKAGYTSSRDTAGALLGAAGVAETVLRPAGKGKFGEQIVDVVTEGDFLLKGDRIRIVAVEGSRVVVEKWT